MLAEVQSFLATATGHGTAGVRDGEPYLEVREGEIEVAEIRYVAARAGVTGSRRGPI